MSTTPTTPGPYDDLLFLGTYGHVVAIDKRSGDTVWKTSLPRGGFALVSIVYEDDTLYCAAGGRLYALQPKDGAVLWRNDLKGMGHQTVYIASAQSSGSQAAQTLLTHAQQVAAASAGGAATA